MLVKSLIFGVLLTIASVTTAHSDSNLNYRGPSIGLSFGIGGADLRIGHGYTGSKFARDRFKGHRLGREIYHGYSKGYGGKGTRSNRIFRGKHNSGRRFLGGVRSGGHGLYR